MRKPGSDAMEMVVLSLCERINTPRALSVWLCFKHNQEDLLNLPMPDIAVDDTGVFCLDYFLTEYLSKYKGLKLPFKTRDIALRKWRLSEDACRETNKRFRDLHFRPSTGRVERNLFIARRKISAVLGPLKLAHVLRDCKWGPGATFDLRRDAATPDKKISEAISVTNSALPYLRAVVESDPHWLAALLGFMPDGACSPLNAYKIVRGSRLITVPKNAKTDRVIAAEPTGNSFLQQGVHSYIRRRLKRFGVDLDDQSINQLAARDAFANGLSTLDLSAASDTISTELVYDLLPLDWALFLDALRSSHTYVDKTWVELEKFASMGNAFCFELETLIFWALASSVDSFGSLDRCVVYGDDIIVPRHAYGEVVEILTFCGFTVNEKKSYATGNFFESCGRHYHKAREVTPVYQKELVSAPSEIIRAHNRLYRLWKAGRVTHDHVSGALRILRDSYPLRPFPRIPEGCDEDGGFLTPPDLLDLNPDSGFRCHVLDYVPAMTQAREDAVYAYKLRRSLHSNPDPKGYCANISKGKWRSRIRHIPISMCGIPEFESLSFLLRSLVASGDDRRIRALVQSHPLFADCSGTLSS